MQEALNQKIMRLLQLGNLPEEQGMDFFERVSGVVFESALNRLLLSLTNDKVAELELYLDTHGDSVNLFAYLTDRYPIFEVYLEEEVRAVQQEVLDIMS